MKQKSYQRNVSILVVTLMSIVFISATVLIIDVNMTATINEPISPLFSLISYHPPIHADPDPTFFDISVDNFAETDLNVSVTWTETNTAPYNMPYVTNMPFTQTLVPGNNTISVSLQCIGSCQTGGQYADGIVNFTRI